LCRARPAPGGHGDDAQHHGDSQQQHLGHDKPPGVQASSRHLPRRLRPCAMILGGKGTRPGSRNRRLFSLRRAMVGPLRPTSPFWGRLEVRFDLHVSAQAPLFAVPIRHYDPHPR
jgi:hypothetical protein